MQTLRTIAAVRGAVAHWRASCERIALVPTMGNLHGGHLALIDRAVQLADRVVVSIFVNPLQFSDQSDYTHYPRTLEEDLQCLATREIAMVFVPWLESIYSQPLESMARVKVRGLSDILEGAYRPGHFSGVATIVTVLFNIVQPHLAVFGEKDYQQLLIIRRMVADLAMPIEIESVATVRDKNGLALSSRNSYLSKGEQVQAPALFGALSDAGKAIRDGRRDFSALEKAGFQKLKTAGFHPDYFYIRRAQDLAEPEESEKRLVILGAAYLGKARLIDNVLMKLKPTG